MKKKIDKNRKKPIIITACVLAALIAIAIIVACCILFIGQGEQLLTIEEFYRPKAQTLEDLNTSPYLMLDEDEINDYMRANDFESFHALAILTTTNDILTAFQFDSQNTASSFAQKVSKSGTYADVSQKQNLVFTSCATSLSSLLLNEIFIWENNYYFALNETDCMFLRFADVKTAFVIPQQANGLAVTQIAYRAFASSKIESVVFPADLTRIGAQSFFTCTSLSSADFSACNKLEEIEERAFAYCVSLPTLSFPSALKEAGAFAFEECTQLKEVSFTSNVQSLGRGIFYSCNSLVDIRFSRECEYVFYQNALYNRQKSQLLFYPSSLRESEYALEESVREIGYGAFADNMFLTKVTGKSVEVIDASAFINCTKLTYAPLSHCYSIGKRAFFNCKSLTNIQLSETLAEIEAEAFRYCNSLTSFTLPSSLSFIGENAFFDCSRLKQITLLSARPPRIGENAFSKPVTVYVPDLAEYRKSDGWGSYYNELVQSEEI